MIKKIIGMLIAVSMLISTGSVYAADFSELYGINDKMEDYESKEITYDSIEYPSPEMNWSSSGIKVAVDGKNIDFPDTKPALDANTERTYVPVRFLAEQLGAEVYWDDAHEVVAIVNKYIEGNNTKLVHYLKIGSNKYLVAQYQNGRPNFSNNFVLGKNETQHVAVWELPSSIAPVLKDGRTMLPFRYVAELMGAQVYYDDDTNTAHCIKRQLQAVPVSGAEKFGYPVLSTLVGEYFTEELNKYRKQYGDTATKQRELTYDGSLSDMMAWAAIDQQIHAPEMQKEFEKYFPDGQYFHYYSDNIGDPYIKGNNVENNKIWKKGAYHQYIKTYLPNFKYSKDGNMLGYTENAYSGRNIISSNGIVNYDKNKDLYIELEHAWGIIVKKDKNETVDSNWNVVPGPKNGEYRYITLFNEEAYRKIAVRSLYIWDASFTHKATLLDSVEQWENKKFGFAIFGDFGYFCIFTLKR